MNTLSMTARRVIVAVVVLAVALAAGWSADDRFHDNSRVTVTAVFADSSPLVPGNKVELHGVQVGTISSIRLVDGKASVEMSLDRAVLPLHADAGAQIQPVSLLGERFVALSQGSPSSPAMNQPYLIPVEHTSSSVDLDQFVGTLNDPTSTALAAMVTTLGEGLAGHGGNIAQALTALPPTLRQADQLSRLLDQQNVVLQNLIVSAQKNATAFAKPLDSLVGAAQQTLGVVAHNRQSLDATLVNLPGTLSDAHRTLGQLGDAADNVGGALAGVRPLTDHLVETSRELHDFADAARPALTPLPDVLDRVDHLLDQARPVVHDLGPSAKGLRGVAGPLATLNDQLLTHPPGVPSALENVMTGAGDWAMATSGYDGLSHYFRAVVTAMPANVLNTAVGTLPALGPSNPVNPVTHNPNGPNEPKKPGLPPLPLMPTLPSLDGSDNSSYTVPRDAPRTAPRGAGNPRRDPGSASGLTPSQEGGMFDQLLGGGN